MRVKIIEHEGCFGIDLHPETVAECALLVRLKINSTKELRSVHASAFKDGTFEGSIVIGKRKETRGHVE